jgi:uncharacterized protein (DUF3820 family)
MDIPSGDREEFRELLVEIGDTNMPFGRFGPDHFPPRGLPIMDLPEEYLAWFQQRGFPNGRLGELLEVVWGIKDVGMDSVFEPLRKVRGGRRSIRKPKRP